MRVRFNLLNALPIRAEHALQRSRRRALQERISFLRLPRNGRVPMEQRLFLAFANRIKILASMLALGLGQGGIIQGLGLFC
jgi:hypothetical protein